VNKQPALAGHEPPAGSIVERVDPYDPAAWGLPDTTETDTRGHITAQRFGTCTNHIGGAPCRPITTGADE